MIRFDPETREVALSVRDLIQLDAAPALRPEPLAVRARAGARAHREHQLETETSGLREGYLAERPIEYRTERGGYRMLVQGRIDGLYREGERWIVEELKTVVFDPGRFPAGALERAVLEEGAYLDYRLQLELYVFFLSAALEAEAAAAAPDGGSRARPEVAGRLVLRGLADGGRAEVELRPDLDRVRSWVEARLDLLAGRLSAEEELLARRREAADRIGFPFPRFRPHQEELSTEVARALEAGEHLLISAPTGIGKTASVLCASLRHALKTGKRVLYLTSKTTQREIVAETLERIASASPDAAPPDGGPPFRAVVLRAREKLCLNLEEAGFIYCHEDFCRHASGYARKVEEHAALPRLLARPVALPDHALALGREAAACPFELTVDAALEADVVVGDFNHVFDPESRLRRILQDRRWRGAVLVIDEAHNLPGRGRESYSPEVWRHEVTALRRWAQGEIGEREEEILPQSAGGGEALRRLVALCRRIEGLLAGMTSHAREELGDPPIFGVDLEPALVAELSAELEAVRLGALIDARVRRPPAAYREGRGRESTPGPGPVEAFAARWSRLAAALEERERVPLLLLYDRTDPRGHRLRVLCLDPSSLLGREMARFSSVVALSATLEPLPLYRDLLGLPAERTRSISLPSPFPEENRRVLVWDKVSTYFRSRSRDSGQVARLIEEITAVERGNYLACFSSYRYLEEVLRLLSPEMRTRCLVQTPGMAEPARDEFLERLRVPGSAWTLLCVQGGIFTEGVDYPGRMLIGAIVVGPGLPAVDFDQERVREHYEDRFQEGFEYAYLCPAMNRVVQSAGRVIRSETDVGVIVLLGERFAQRQYARFFPSEWYRSSPRELITGDVLGALREFWEGRRAAGAGDTPDRAGPPAEASAE